MKKNKSFVKIIIILVLVGFLCYCAVDYFILKPTKVPYINFIEELNKKNIKDAIICSNVIEFTTLDTNTKFQVPNPQNSNIAERLLLANATVKFEQSTSEIFTLIFDIIFYAFFIVIIFFVFKKFISPNTFKIIKKTNVKFDDIIGMDDLKKSMIQIAQMMKKPKDFNSMGIRMPKGILMEGDPGNGKTLFARALAGESGVNFIAAKATDFESMFMAIGPAKVKMLFQKARKNAPCIVFIDEFDGIGTKRNYSGSAIETENTRIVTALLNELDGFTPNDGVLVLAATNSREALDAALIRPGRFDAKYTVPYPNEESRVKLIQKYTNNKKLHPDISLQKLAKTFSGFSCAHIESVMNRSIMFAQQDSRDEINITDIQSALSEL